MSGTEAVALISLFDACIGITRTIIDIGRAVRNAQGLPPKLRDLFERLPAIEDLLNDFREACDDDNIDEEKSKNAQPLLQQCETALKELRTIIQRACPKDGASRTERLWKGTKTVFLGRESKVQALLIIVLDNLKLLEQHQIYAIGDKLDELQELTEALGNDDHARYSHTGPGNIIANEGGQPTNYVMSGSGRQINNPGVYNESAQIYLPSAAAPPPPEPEHCMQFKRDSHYVERADLTQQLHALLNAPGGRAALVGIGGVGYWDQHRDRWVFWIYASSVQTFENRIRQLTTKKLKIAGAQEANANIFELFSEWLGDKRNGPWLIVLDNVDDAGFLVQQSDSGRLIDCIPICQHGAMMITSRNRHAARQIVDEHEIINVPRMNEEDAISLLSAKLGKGDPVAQLKELAEALEFMPLAITQASSYLIQNRGRNTIDKYLQHLRDLDESCATFLDDSHIDHRRDRSAVNSVIKTWYVSFEDILEKKKPAAELLMLMSLCDRSSIPELLIGYDTADYTRQAADFEENINILLSFSLITQFPDASTFGMHRLVQVATRRWCVDRGQIYTQVEHFLLTLNQRMPHVDECTTDAGEPFFLHAKSAMDLEPYMSLSILPQWADVMSKATGFASCRDNRVMMDQAIEIGERCMKTMQRQLGEDHIETIRSRIELPRLYAQSGDSLKAIRLTEQLLSELERLFGNELQDSHTLYLRWQLATYHDALGDSEQAVQIGERCVEALQEIFGKDDRVTLAATQDLAGFYRSLGDLTRAAETGRECYEAMQRTFGKNHPQTIMSMGNLAAFFNDIGNHKEALQMGKQCFEACRAILGDEHPKTITYMGNLATYYQTLGNSKEAMRLGLQCFEARRNQLGEEHPDTLLPMMNLASYHERGNDFANALLLGRECWQKCRRVFGEDHPHTLASMSNLSKFYRRVGENETAVVVGEQCHFMQQTKLGENHPSTIVTVAGLADCYSVLGDKRTAAEYAERCLKASLISFGGEHPKTLVAMNNLACAHAELRNHKEAFELGLRCWQISLKQLGEEHSHTRLFRHNLDRFCARLADSIEAAQRNTSSSEDAQRSGDERRSLSPDEMPRRVRPRLS